MTNPFLFSVGPLLGMAGVALLFHWEPPRTTVDEETGAPCLHREWNKFIANCGLSLVFFGFLVQLLAVWA